MNKWLRLHMFHERNWNRLARVWVKGQGLRLVVGVGKYTLQLYAGGVRSKD